MLESLLVWDERVFRLLNEEWLNPVLDRLMPFVTDAGWWGACTVFVSCC
jgi:hypothetical protein